MWADRLAEVWAAPKHTGTGAVLAADLVVTARHVVAAALDGGAILARVVRPSVQLAGWIPMRALADDADWDIALLQVDPAPAGDAALLATTTEWEPPSSTVPAIVRLGVSAEPGCEAVGFPRSEIQRSPSGGPVPLVRQSEQATGTLLPAGHGKTPVRFRGCLCRAATLH